MAYQAAAPDTLSATLDRLARFEPTRFPVISLYLNLQPDQHGKDNEGAFVRKELPARARTYPQRSAERESFEADIARINRYLSDERSPSLNGLAIFACHAAGEFFEAVPLNAPIPAHRLSVGPQPHLYPLALILDQNPAHAVVVADSHFARVYVFGLNQPLRTEMVEGEKTKRTRVGGWSQMRYQRHVDKLRDDHVRELVGVLARVVRQEQIDRIILAGDDVNVTLVRDELPKELVAKVVDVMKVEAHASEHDVMQAALDVIREHDAKTDAEVVRRVIDEYRAGGLAVAGSAETWQALERMQVDELYLAANGVSEDPEITADALVTKARQGAAAVRFIEDPALLRDVGGVAATLRYRVA